MGLASSTKTLQNVIDRVTRQFGDESGSQITVADITNWTNAALREIVKKNRFTKAQSTTPSVAGQNQYSFASLSILNIEHLHYEGKALDYKGFVEAQEYINKYDPSLSNTGTPTIWYEWGTVLYVYPVPQVSGDDITVYYVQLPAEVTNTSDVLTVPDTYFEVVVQYVLQQAYEQDDDWQGSAIKAQQVDASLNVLAEDPNRYNRGRFMTITVLEEDM